MQRPKAKYRAWILIRGGVDRFGSELFKTSREAMIDAVKILQEVRNDPGVQWRNEIETYGSVLDFWPLPGSDPCSKP